MAGIGESVRADKPRDTLPGQAPPLTLQNVFEAVKAVRRNWRDVGGGLLGWGSHVLVTIRRQHGSDKEACLKAVIDDFLSPGEGDYQPSWRRVIHVLYDAGETRIAQDIISYAEPVEDPTLTVDDVTKVINKIEGDKVEVMGKLGVPGSLLEEIEKRYSTYSEKSYAYADYYVHVHPDASWEHLTEALCCEEEWTAARESKLRMPTDPILTVDDVTKVINKIEGDKVEVMEELDVPESLLEEIEKRYSTYSEKSHAYADFYVHVHPKSSWEHLTKALCGKEEWTAARESKSHIMSTDPTLTVDDVTKVINKIEGDKVKVMGWWGLGVPESLLVEIEKRYSTDREKSHAYADYYVHIHPDPSWKHLTEKLCEEGEWTAARESKSFSTDPTLTVENMNRVMAKVEPKEREKLYWEVLDFRIKMKQNSIDYVDAYVSYDPSSSWQLLARALYQHHHVAAVEEVRTYLPPRDLTITADKLMELFALLDPEKVDRLGDKYELDLPAHEVDKIKENYQSPARRKEAYLHLYVHQHPCPSWQDVAVVLRNTFNLDQQADFVENTYVKATAKHLPQQTAEITTKSKEQKEIVKKSEASSSSTEKKTYEPDLPSAKVDVVRSKQSWCVQRAMEKPDTTTPRQDGQTSSSTGALDSQQTAKAIGLLCIDDLRDVLKAVWEARSRWYNMGLELGTSPGTLDSISLKGRDDPDLCITHMIKDRLNNGNPRPTWAAVAKALKSPMVGYGHLAGQLPSRTT